MILLSSAPDLTILNKIYGFQSGIRHTAAKIMAKSSADDKELRRACESAIEDTKQKVVMSIRVAKSKGAWGKGKFGKGAQMAKPRVLAISSKLFTFLCLCKLSIESICLYSF